MRAHCGRHLPLHRRPLLFVRPCHSAGLLRSASLTGRLKINWNSRALVRSNDAIDYFQIPTGRVVEVGPQVTI
jgi:hypothetical protein